MIVITALALGCVCVCVCCYEAFNFSRLLLQQVTTLDRSRIIIQPTLALQCNKRYNKCKTAPQLTQRSRVKCIWGSGGGNSIILNLDTNLGGLLHAPAVDLPEPPVLVGWVCVFLRTGRSFASTGNGTPNDPSSSPIGHYTDTARLQLRTHTAVAKIITCFKITNKRSRCSSV